MLKNMFIFCICLLISSAAVNGSAFPEEGASRSSEMLIRAQDDQTLSRAILEIETPEVIQNDPEGAKIQVIAEGLGEEEIAAQDQNGYFLSYLVNEDELVTPNITLLKTISSILFPDVNYKMNAYDSRLLDIIIKILQSIAEDRISKINSIAHNLFIPKMQIEAAYYIIQSIKELELTPEQITKVGKMLKVGSRDDITSGMNDNELKICIAVQKTRAFHEWPSR